MNFRNRKLTAAALAFFAFAATESARCAATPMLVSIFASGFESGNLAGWSDAVPPACDDGIRDGDETDVDCGGLICGVCQPGQNCNQTSDCDELPGWTQAYALCSGGTCGMGCSGENYDFDGSIVNGCEVVDSPLGNHTQGTAFSLGSVDCFDGGGNTVPFAGSVPSDQREHAFPTVGGFNSASGSAPDYLKVQGTGGIACTNDIAMFLVVTGSTIPGCYQLTVTTDQTTISCQSNPGGTCATSCGSGCYTDDSTIYFKVEKTCSAAMPDNPAYNVSGHL